ncbi:MAG: lipocalin family protein [Chitinispirillaceae bacterium]|jgi:lipocalin
MRERIQFFAVILAAGLMSQASAQKFTPVDNFSLEKYLGTWYEIARMPVSFENDLHNVTATYSLREDGKVSVVNRGIRSNGRETVAHGKAKFAAAQNIGHLKVSFFWFFYSDYIIVDLDSAYQYSMVAGSSTNYLWILSRKPQLDNVVLQQLLNNAKTLGYDTSKLIMTLQQ